MPWPQNSRTTEKPFFSANCWIEKPMSPRWMPGLTRMMPCHMASNVRPHRRLAAIDTSPTVNIRLVSPNQPSLITVTSTLTMSPFLRGLSLGMPWQTTWLTEVQSDAG